jgi:hypothetical protein
MHKVSDGVRSTHSEDGGVVLDVQHGQMFGLNLVGSKILQLLEGGSAEPAITAQISREFGIREEVVQADLKEFIETLTRHHLLEISGLDIARAPETTDGVP